MLRQALCIISYPLVNSNLSYSPETPNLGQIWRFLEPCDLEIWRMTLKNNRAPLLCYFKLCAWFPIHWWIQTWVTVRKRPIWGKFDDFRAVRPWNLADDLEQGKSEGFESCDRPRVRKCQIWIKIGDVLFRVTLKFDGWPWKTIGLLSFAVSSFVQHFIAISEFKLELQFGNAQSRSISTILLAVWPWNLTDDLQKQ